MELTLAYAGRSGLETSGSNRVLHLATNLVRQPVSFDAAIRQPLAFREAISALHDVVISDLRYKPRDRTAYETWQAEQKAAERSLRQRAYQEKRAEIDQHRGGPMPAALEKDFQRARRRYWSVRQKYSTHLRRYDRDLWRLLMPCDPIVTVADDVVFFECFSADESSYGCLTVDRGETFEESTDTQTGTTNVDYSWALYNHFQSLRSYRQTRFQVAAEAVNVQTHGAESHREEKIDLPTGWLRGLLQTQNGMAMPLRRVSLSRESVYSLLAWLKRHKAKRSPRAIRFELQDGQSPVMVLEPWEMRITSQRTKYYGPSTEPVRIWGRRRLLSLARVLPLAHSVDVYLLGNGLPSFWVVRMGSQRLTLGLSGWTTNDWTRGSALDALAPPVELSAGSLANVAEFIEQRRSVSLVDVCESQGITTPEAAALLNRLAHTGEVIYDLVAGVYRQRRILPNALGHADLGPENIELVESRRLLGKRVITIKSDETSDNGYRSLTGVAAGKPVELLLDGDGTIKSGRCLCGHHQKAGLRMGPCRHLLAMRTFVLSKLPAVDTKERLQSLKSWYDRLQAWAN